MPKKYIIGLLRGYDHNRVFVGRSEKDTCIDIPQFDFDDFYNAAARQIDDPLTKIMFFFWIKWNLSFREISAAMEKLSPKNPKSRWGKQWILCEKGGMSAESVRKRLSAAVDKMVFAEKNFIKN